MGQLGRNLIAISMLLLYLLTWFETYNCFMNMGNSIQIKLESSRLFIKPLDYEHLLIYRELDLPFEFDYGKMSIKRRLSTDLLLTIENSVLPYIKKNPSDILYGTLWIIISKMANVIIGDIGFKGRPSDNGLIEIGYGIYPEFFNNGYMTEAVEIMVTWAFDQPEVRIILAETSKENIPSQKVLNKNRFKIFAETEFNYWWRLDKDSKDIN